MKIKLLFLAISFSLSPVTAHADVTWICSTADQHWQTMPSPALEPAKAGAAAQIRVAPSKTYQTIDGFGGCFNELGWRALASLSPDDRSHAMSALFGDDGCAFNMARVPVGASDFATDAYSLDDTPGDYQLKHFSIDRDKQLLIPFIKSAMTVRPDLECWASPWSPPAWMKTNNNYSSGEVRNDPQVFSSYANYLARWVHDYQDQGIHIIAMCPQNEPNVSNVYPTCYWSGEELRSFIADYMGPTFRDQKINAQIWLGTLNDSNTNDRAVSVLEDPKANPFVSAVTFQYDGKLQIADVRELYPDKKLVQSETECADGKNSWHDAQHLYALMLHYLDRGASSYFAWNMVLDETGASSWKWKQNAMITANQQTHALVFNGEYFVMRHFSQFIRSGAKRVLTTGFWGDKIAFINPDGSIVLVVGNTSGSPLPVTLRFAGADHDTLNVQLPAVSISTFVVRR